MSTREITAISSCECFGEMWMGSESGVTSVLSSLTVRFSQWNCCSCGLGSRRRADGLFSSRSFRGNRARPKRKIFQLIKLMVSVCFCNVFVLGRFSSATFVHFQVAYILMLCHFWGFYLQKHTSLLTFYSVFTGNLWKLRERPPSDPSRIVLSSFPTTCLAY